MVTKKVRTIPAGEFQAKCLKLIDEVAETGEEIVVTKRGAVQVRVVREREEISDSERRRLRARLRDSVEIVGDIVAPTYGDYEPREIPFGSLAGTIAWQTDIVSPTDDGWDGSMPELSVVW